MFKKRLSPAYKIEQKADKDPIHEESEEIKEDVIKDNQIDLTK